MVLFVLGAIIGSTLDGFHTHSGTLAYTHPWKWQMAAWVPLLFGVASVGLTQSVPWLDRLLKRPRRRQSWFSVLTGLLAFFFVYYLSGFWQVDSGTKAILIAIIGLAFWLESDRTWQGLVEGVLVAAIGCLVEATLIQIGAFSYLTPDFAGIPFWLGSLYFCASVAVGNSGRLLFSSQKER